MDRWHNLNIVQMQIVEESVDEIGNWKFYFDGLLFPTSYWRPSRKNPNFENIQYKFGPRFRVAKRLPISLHFENIWKSHTDRERKPMYLLSAPRKLNSLMTPPTSDDSKIGSIIKGQMGYALSKKYICTDSGV